MRDMARLFVGPLGSGKTYRAIEAACEFLGVENSNEIFVQMCQEGRIAYVQLSPNSGYESFVAGVSVSTDQQGRINYKFVDKVFAEICSEALTHKDLGYCIILDDLDRVNIGCLFGELINAIEYRNERVTTSGGKALIVPDNLLIIGTINSINQNDSDYAILRRFKMQGIVESKETIRKFYSDQDSSVIDTIVEIYEKINLFIDKNISADYSDAVKEYHICPPFYLKSHIQGQSPLRAVYSMIDHIVFPILRQYVSDGIMDCSYQEVSSFKNSLELASREIMSNRSDRIKKVVYNDESDKWEEEAVSLSVTKQSYLAALVGQARGYKAELFRFVFEAISFSNILPASKLFNEILNNTRLIKVSNRYADHRTNEMYAAFVAEQSISDQFKYSTQGGKITCSVYSGTAVGQRVKPQYIINGKQYVIASGFRDGGASDASLSLYEPTLLAPLYHFAFVYKLVVSYYNLLVEGFEQIGEDVLKDLATIELNYFCRSVKALGGWENLLPNLTLLWSAAEDSILVSKEKIGELLHEMNSMSFIKLYEDYIGEIHEENVVIPELGVGEMINSYKDIMDLLNTHQMILQGPPGTSKTYGAKRFIAERIRKTESSAEPDSVLLAKNQLDESGYSDGSTLTDAVYWDIVQFHPSYDYEDFVRGIDVRPGPCGIEYVTVNKTLGKIAELAGRPENRNKEFYLIIDEINRANIASVFGELIYALEYRDNPIETPYIVNGKSTIILPHNLYLIGTMNTADKSIGNIDYAIKRRFIFFSSLSNRDVVLDCAKGDEASVEIRAYDIVAQLFKDYLNTEYNLDDVQLGHTYFLREKGDTDEMSKTRMLEKMRYQIIPILREYFKDGILESKVEISENEATAQLMEIIEKYGAFENVDDEISNWLDKYLS